jgi:acyl dehydratase
MKQSQYEEASVGLVMPPDAHTVSRLDLYMYAAATWNLFRVHIEKEYAQENGFRDANIAAPYYGAFMAQVVTRWTGLGGRLKKLSYRVTVMGFPGDTLICRGKIGKKYFVAEECLLDIEIWIENQHDRKVVVGSSTVAVPDFQIRA